ncbi:hypothetical protein ACFFRR_008863 [Megaselia abdita]
MAAQVENLESLSNADLREQCKIFGLPNVPVTDTSRKILIRKLKLAMEGPANGEKDKTKRRETIHVVSKPVEKKIEIEVKKSLDVSRSSGRRTTIAATSSIPEPEKIDRRRSSRYSSTSSEKKPVELKRKTAILEEDSDDDLELVQAVENAEKTQKEVTPSRTKAASSQESRERRSRSASLQKSPTVTTSYNKDVVPSTVHETEESETDNEILTQNVYKYNDAKPFVPTKTERQTYYKPTVVPSLNVSSSRYSNLGTTSTARHNITTATTVTSGLGTSNLSRRYTTGTTHKYDDDEEDDDVQEVEIGGGHTPYYSDFTRRLERLKNEQLNLSGKKEREREVPLSRNYPRRQMTSAAVQNDAFKGFFMNLDRKYGIKQKLMIIGAVFLLLTIYVFIFH